MSIAKQSDALRANRAVLAIVNRIDRNTRAVAKVTSAVEWVLDGGGDPTLLYPALCALIHERRNMRVQLESELGWQQGKQSA
jgi:uncharacterized Fe-S cluster-containing radical SAM superfamily enzyme